MHRHRHRHVNSNKPYLKNQINTLNAKTGPIWVRRVNLRCMVVHTALKHVIHTYGIWIVGALITCLVIDLFFLTLRIMMEAMLLLVMGRSKVVGRCNIQAPVYAN